MSDISIELGHRMAFINRKHIDGPLLVCSDGTLHWLTLFERILFAAGFTNVEKLNVKYSSIKSQGTANTGKEGKS